MEIWSVLFLSSIGYRFRSVLSLLSIDCGDWISTIPIINWIWRLGQYYFYHQLVIGMGTVLFISSIGYRDLAVLF